MTKQELEPQIIALLKEGKAITALRLVQKELQYGLKEAKDYIDKFIDSRKWQ
jgi:ribosomal protein L7/L12